MTSDQMRGLLRVWYGMVWYGMVWGLQVCHVRTRFRFRIHLWLPFFFRRLSYHTVQYSTVRMCSLM
jgi:hypothetical protein